MIASEAASTHHRPRKRRASTACRDLSGTYPSGGRLSGPAAPKNDARLRGKEAIFHDVGGAYGLIARHCSVETAQLDDRFGCSHPARAGSQTMSFTNSMA
jgi:hypothetical protein